VKLLLNVGDRLLEPHSPGDDGGCLLFRRHRQPTARICNLSVDVPDLWVHVQGCPWSPSVADEGAQRAGTVGVAEIPQPHGVVEAAGGQGVPIRAERHRQDVATVRGPKLYVRPGYRAGLRPLGSGLLPRSRRAVPHLCRGPALITALDTRATRHARCGADCTAGGAGPSRWDAGRSRGVVPVFQVVPDELGVPARGQRRWWSELQHPAPASSAS
jgi:hypothetical protein